MRKNKKNKISPDYGMTDYYNFYIKNNPDSTISRKKFNKVISEVNKGIIDLMLEESFEFKIPHINCTLIIKKDKRVPKIKDGKVINSAPIDWKTTKKLWANDEEAKNEKILVKFTNSHTSGFVFRIYFKKFGGTFKNRSFYKFTPARGFKRALTERINDTNKDKFDSYLLY